MGSVPIFMKTYLYLNNIFTKGGQYQIVVINMKECEKSILTNSDTAFWLKERPSLPDKKESINVISIIHTIT